VRRLPVLLVRELVEQLHLLHQVARLVADQLDTNCGIEWAGEIKKQTIVC
jgi:hypothetical protein